ncbi:hypothetical protein SSX86_000885 [Deinandra increscens subsp. villosa]|uniref:Uncharacterized protein n=1 Tax=Deinandra increscens subsp. villosa TaxID=3103831 RepID=A0AAP0HE03_9ASTR
MEDEGRRKALKVNPAASSEMEETTVTGASSVTYPFFPSSPPPPNNDPSDYGFSKDTLIKCIRGKKKNIFIHRRPGAPDLPGEDRCPYVCITGDFPPLRLGVIPVDDSMTEAIKQSRAYKEAIANGLEVKLMGSSWEARLPACNDDHNRDQATH